MKKTKKTSKNIKKFFNSSEFFLFLSLIFFIAIFLYLGITYTDFSIKSFFSEPKEITIDDDCSVIAGRMVHEIRDEQDCELQCKNRCNIEERKLSSSDFTQLHNSCHRCECICE